MKNQLKFAFGILLLLSLFANVSACVRHNNYNDYAPGRDDGVILIVQERDYYDYSDLHDWENEDRYSLYDYRWGYSYRFSDEYQVEKDRREMVLEEDDGYDYDERGYYGAHYAYQDEPSIKYVYSDYMRSYQEVECYDSPPRNRLFYIKC